MCMSLVSCSFYLFNYAVCNLQFYSCNNFQTQEADLRSKPDIVVATPGRLIDHLRNSMSVDLDDLSVLIFDEADRLLEDGFSAEIRELVFFF